MLYCLGELILSKFFNLFSALNPFKNPLGYYSVTNLLGCASLHTDQSVELYISVFEGWQNI